MTAQVAQRRQAVTDRCLLMQRGCIHRLLVQGVLLYSKSLNWITVPDFKTIAELVLYPPLCKCSLAPCSAFSRSNVYTNRLLSCTICNATI